MTQVLNTFFGENIFVHQFFRALISESQLVTRLKKSKRTNLAAVSEIIKSSKIKQNI
jgi:hypothetical protein